MPPTENENQFGAPYLVPAAPAHAGIRVRVIARQRAVLGWEQWDGFVIDADTRAVLFTTTRWSERQALTEAARYAAANRLTVV